MSDSLTIIPQPVAVPRPPGPVSSSTTPNPDSGRFDQLLTQRLEQSRVQFSRHADTRMESRGIRFSPQQIERLESAVNRVNAKGGRDSLVMLDGTALVVSVKNETVVTVMDHEQMKNNVFTNIDSAVIA